YGNVVVIDHGNGVATLYAHLSAITVGVGDALDTGDVLGEVGCTGRCFGDHLHFELRVNEMPIDPIPYLPGGTLFAGLGPTAVDDVGGSQD
ncbi:MAG: M23 family metallopeptidase, partial [Actinomycetota bacterium]